MTGSENNDKNGDLSGQKTRLKELGENHVLLI
jgi:hypothetical protein